MHQINEKVANITYKALEQSRACSNSMDLVPRPGYSRPDIKAVLKELANISRRITNDNAEIYVICKNAIKIKYKTAISMALMGV